MAVEYNDRLRCSACDFPIDPKTTPRGGEFHHVTKTVTVQGRTTVCDGNGAQGCPFCGTPAWDGLAKLGDMEGWHRRH